MEQESPSYTEHQRKEGKIPLKGDLKKKSRFSQNHPKLYKRQNHH